MGMQDSKPEVVVVRVGMLHEHDCKIIPKFSGGDGECDHVVHGLTSEQPDTLSSFGPGILEMGSLLDEHECLNCVRLQIVLGWSLVCQRVA